MSDVRFLGKPDLVGIGKTTPPASAEEWKRVGVLAYLCLNLPLRLHTDTALASLLWPGLNPALGRRRVERAIEWLNSFSPETIVDSTRFGEYEAIQATMSVDVWAFRGGLRMKRYEDALTLYGGTVLEGMEFTDAPEFMEWLRRLRSRYARLASLCAWRSYGQALERGDRSLATGLLVLAYERSPVPKPDLARVMGLLASAGASEEALRLFERAPEPTEEAIQLARKLAPAAQVETPGRPRLAAGVAGLALLIALAVLALPNWRGDDPQPTEPAVEDVKRAEKPPSVPEGGPLDPDLIWDIANQHMAARNYQQAETLFRLLARDPEFGDRATEGFWLANIYGAIPAGDPVHLYDLVQQAPPEVFHLTEGPLDKAQFLGWIVAPYDSLLARGHFQEAKRRAETRIVEQTSDPWGYRNLALAALGLNEREQAAAALEQAEILATAAGSAHLLSKLLEARAMVAAPDTEERRTLLQELQSPDHPWRPDSTQLARDPRWR